MDNLIETDLSIVYPEMTLGELVKVISKSNRNIFPVVEHETNKLVGIVSLDEVRNIMFRPNLYDRFTVRKLMNLPPSKIIINTPMDKVMDIFEDTKDIARDIFNLMFSKGWYTLTPEEENKITKSYNKYSDKLKELS